MATEERAELVRGLRELADFLAEHPDLYFPDAVSCSVGARDGDAAAIARIDAWRAAGFHDLWGTPIEGHHRVHLKFGGFSMQLSYVEAGKSHPIAWGKTAGEPSPEFQARVDAALDAEEGAR